MADKLQREIYLDNQPFNIKAYLRSVTDDLVSRFGSAEQGQSNLDLLKSGTQKSVRGGMFQREFDDPEKVSSITNGYFNKFDNNVYPTPYWNNSNFTGSASEMTASGVTSYCYYKGAIYYTFQLANPPSTGYNQIWKVDPATNSFSYITGVFSNGGSPIKLFAFGDWMYVCQSPGAGSHFTHTFDGTTFVATGSQFHDMAAFNDKLYGVDANHNLYQITATTASSITHGGTLGAVSGSPGPAGNLFQSMLDYNGALYIAMQNGLWRYDGVAVKPVIDMRRSVNPMNFKYMAVYNGRLYYTIGNKIFKFDGTNIEELQDFTSAYTIVGLSTGGDRLWISVRYDTGVPFSDKFASGASSYGLSAFVYNDIGFFEYWVFTTNGTVPEISTVNSIRSTLIPFNDRVFFHFPYVSYNGSMEIRSTGHRGYVLDLKQEFQKSGFPLGCTIVTSDIDCDYPSVPKVLNGVMLNYGGLTGGEGSIKIEANYLYEGLWSGWSEIWNTQNVGLDGITNDYLLHEQVNKALPYLPTEPGLFHKLRLRTTLTMTDFTPATMPYLGDQTARYTLQPRFRKKWLVDIDLAGKDIRAITTPRMSNRKRETRTANTMRKVIYDAIRNKVPVLFYDVDATEVKSRDGSTIVVSGTDMFSARDVIAIQTQANGWVSRQIETISYDYVDDETTIEFSAAGQRIGVGASSAADSAIATGDRVRLCHAVYIRNIRNERYLLDDNTTAMTDGYTSIPSQITLDLVEV